MTTTALNEITIERMTPSLDHLEESYRFLEYVVGYSCDCLHWYFSTVVEEDDDFANLVVAYLKGEASITAVADRYFFLLHKRNRSGATPFLFTLSVDFKTIHDRIDDYLLRGSVIVPPFKRGI